jgi:predicted O-methyltransferase YrrM
MTQALYSEIDEYIEQLFVGRDAALDAAVQSTIAAGMPQIQVSASLGKVLYLLAKLANAERILELGTLAGYSTLWLARALPAHGKLVTMEADSRHAEVAIHNLANAGFAQQVELMQGPALQSLQQLADRGVPAFDMVFIDADKVNYPAYLDWAIQLSRRGALIVADNVVRAGAVLNPAADDVSALGAHQFNVALAADPRVEAIVLQQVGLKGHDGIAVARVR